VDLLAVATLVSGAGFSLMVYGAVGTNQVLVVAGAGLFYVFDAQLALNRFYRPYRWADYGVMSTYYLAQYCLAIRIGSAT